MPAVWKRPASGAASGWCLARRAAIALARPRRPTVASCRHGGREQRRLRLDYLPDLQLCAGKRAACRVGVCGHDCLCRLKRRSLIDEQGPGAVDERAGGDQRLCAVNSSMYARCVGRRRCTAAGLGM